MGESACLLRSFSHPSDASREPREGDPTHVLGESISFGRFMTESLAWEKWSSFSHNRYLEEVEKFSKPGYVAQKKAYFEAHYKKKAAQKAATELEKASTPVRNEVETDQNCTSTSTDSELLRAHSQVVSTDEQQDLVQNSEFVSSISIDALNSTNERAMVETPEMEEEEEEEEIIDQNNYLETSPNMEYFNQCEKFDHQNMNVENFNQCEKVDDQNMNVVAEDDNMPAIPSPERETVASGSLKGQRKCSSKLITESMSSKSSSSLANQATIQQPIHRRNAATKIKKHGRPGDIAERLTTKSIHMSIQFNSRPKELGKSSSDLSQIGRKRTLMSSVAVSKEPPTRPKKIANRASVNGLLKQSSVKPQEDRRSLKSSNTSGSKERSPLICSPFSFRSEERAAKRKEFFQKLKEKVDFKETGPKELHERCQEKTENDSIKVNQSRIFKDKVNRDSNQGLKSSGNHIKKVPVTRPISPKLGRKPATKIVQDRRDLSPRKKMNATKIVTSNSSKCVARTKCQGTAQLVTSIVKKMNACENRSPNIQS